MEQKLKNMNTMAKKAHIQIV